MPGEVITVRGNASVARLLQAYARDLRQPRLIGNLTFATGEAIRNYMVINMLRGQRLKRQSGILSGSFNTQRLPNGAADMGTNKKYAPPHEFGFRGTVHKRIKKTGTSFTARMNLRARYYLRDSVRLSVSQQRRAIEVAFERIGRGV